MATTTMPTFLTRLLRPFTSSTSMSAAPSTSGDPSTSTTTTTTFPANAQKATFAAGCFWGVEHIFRKGFPPSSGALLSSAVGYIGGDTASPSYRAVCSGRTGHAEALQLVFDPDKVSYGQLVEFFYRMHDPTTKGRQGGDVGSQYRSAVFWHDEAQREVAERVTAKANTEWWGGKVATEVLPAGQWWDAETYHQLYLDKNPGGYECPSHYLRSFPALSK